VTSADKAPGFASEDLPPSKNPAFVYEYRVKTIRMAKKPASYKKGRHARIAKNFLRNKPEGGDARQAPRDDPTKLPSWPFGIRVFFNLVTE